MSKKDELISMKTIKIIIKCYDLTHKEANFLFSFHHLSFRLERATDLQEINDLQHEIIELKTEITKFLIEKGIHNILKDFFN